MWWLKERCDFFLSAPKRMGKWTAPKRMGNVFNNV